MTKPKPSRIVIAGPWNPSSNSRFHRRVASRLAELGADVTYLSDRKPYEVSEAEQHIAIEVFPTRSARTISDLRWAIQRLQQLKPDRMIVRFGPSTTMLIAARITGVPIRISVASSSPSAFSGSGGPTRFLRRFRRTSVRRFATDVWTYSAGMVEELEEAYGIRRDVIAVHAMGISSIRQDLERTTDVITVGRVCEAKGQRYLVKALAGTGLSLAVVGTGPDDELVRELADKHQVRATFFGHLDHDRTFTELNRAKVSVLLTRADSFGLALVESLAAATPVVSTRASGPSAIIRDGIDGELVREIDSDSVREAIERVIGADWHDYSTAAYERFQSRFELETAADRYARAILGTA